MYWIYGLPLYLIVFIKETKNIKMEIEDYEKSLPLPTINNSSMNELPSKDNDFPLSEWIEKELIQFILHDYDKRSRPVFDNITTTIISKDNETIQQITIEFGLSLIQILDLNEMEQVITTSVRSLYRWQDLHLQWNPEDFHDITFVFIPSNKIWIPDISLYNYADERLEERRPCNVKIYNDGTIEWQPRAIYKTTCSVNIKYFPFDIQVCWLKFGPWTYDGFRVNITFYNQDPIFDLSSLEKSPEWAILKSWANHTELRYPCCEEPYPDISFYVKLKRSPVFYTYILILPCFLLSSLTLVLFWLPPESPAKMVLGMNIFVAFFLMLLLLENTTPSASKNFPLLGTYYCFNMGIITLSTFLSCIIVNFHFRGDNRQEVPFWLKKLAFELAAKVLCINFGSKFQRKDEIVSPTKNAQPIKKLTKDIFLTENAYDNEKAHKNNEKKIGLNVQDKYVTIPTFKCSEEMDAQEVKSAQCIQRWIRFDSTTVTDGSQACPDSVAQDSGDSSSHNRKQSQSHLLTPTVFPGECFNSDIFRRLQSYSPLHSPILQQNLKFIDEIKTDPSALIPCNRDSLYSSLPLLQDALALSNSQLLEYSTKLQVDNKLTSSILRKKNYKCDDNEQNLFGTNPRQHRKICDDVKAIVKSLKYIQKLQENNEHVSRVYSEWRSVGLVLDRIFFFSYIFIITFSIIMYFPKANQEI